jgi:retron-type reverse transcriptase
MADDEKARLYRQLVQQTDEQTALERMRLHGFWPQRQPLPEEPPAEAEERARLEAEIAKVRKEASAVKNPQKALAKERKRRWLASKQRRAEAKARRAAEQEKRREEWDAHRRSHVVHLGAGVSAGLAQDQSDVARLGARGLPVMHNGTDLAARLGVKLGALRWLTYHRRAAAVVHYHRFDIAKKTGGLRSISAPKRALAQCQRWVLDNVLGPLEVGPQAHGFVPGRSVVSNARPHVGRAVVVNLDLRDFFPSITFRRVKGLFHALGYSEHVATVLALLCTEPPRVPAEVDGKVYHVALGGRVLPQGACTSPAITNALCRRLDRRLDALARRHGFAYTRYADDLTFSGDDARAVGRLLRSARSIVQAEGFAEQPSKTRVMRQARRQEVTGVTVNRRPTVSRKEVRTLRAVLHNVAKHGLESQNRAGLPHFAAHLRGRVEYVCMIDPERAPALRAALHRALARGG